MSVQPAVPPNAPNAVLALVLGIIGIVLCPLCGPFAWKFGSDSERAADASGGTLGGRGLATAGKILGIISTVLMTIYIVLLIVLIGFGVSNS